MGYYNKWAVLIVPAAIKQNAINFLTKHGITGDCFADQPLILEADSDAGAARAYVAVLKCDNHMVAVLQNGADLNPNAHVFISTKKTTAQKEVLHFIRTKGFRIKPKYWVGLIVRAGLQDEILALLATHDIVPTQTRALILKTDGAGHVARAYAAMITADKYMIKVINRKAMATTGVFAFASENKATSQAEILAFIDSKGYKIK